MTIPSKAKKTAETKIGDVIKLLRRKNGATLDQLVNATGWQPHTVRSAFTGLRKKGHSIAQEKRGDTSYYTITEPAA